MNADPVIAVWMLWDIPKHDSTTIKILFIKGFSVLDKVIPEGKIGLAWAVSGSEFLICWVDEVENQGGMLAVIEADVGKILLVIFNLHFHRSKLIGSPRG